MNQFPSGVPFGDAGDPLILFNPATGWMAWKPPAGQAPSIPGLFPQLPNFQFPGFPPNMSVLDGSMAQGNYGAGNSFMATPRAQKRKDSPSESYSSEAANPVRKVKLESNSDDEIQNIESSCSDATPPSYRKKSRRKTFPTSNATESTQAQNAPNSSENQSTPMPSRGSAGVICTLCADLGSDRHFLPSSVEFTNHAVAHARQTKKSVREAIAMCFPTPDPDPIAKKPQKQVTPQKVPALRQVQGTQTPLRNKQQPATITKRGSQTTRKVGSWTTSDREETANIPDTRGKPPIDDQIPMTEAEFVKEILSDVGREFYLKNRTKHGEASQLDNELRLFVRDVEKNPDHQKLGLCNVPRCNYRCRRLSTAIKTHRSISAHILSHFPDPLFHCTLCDDFFRQGPSHHYAKHQGSPIAQHNKDRRWTREKELIDLFRRCFTSIEDLNKPGNTPQPREMLPELGYVDLMKQTLSPEFVKKLHGIRNRYATAPKSLKCAICSYAVGGTSTLYSLFGHISKHHDNPHFQCLECGINNKFPLTHTKNYHRGTRPRYRMFAEDEALKVLNDCFPGPVLESQTTNLDHPVSREKLIRNVVSDEMWEALNKARQSYNRDNFKCSIKNCKFSGGGNLCISAILTHVAGAHHKSPAFKCITCEFRIKNIQYHVGTTHKNSMTDVEIVVMDEVAVKAVLKKCFPGPDAKKSSSGSSGKSLMQTILNKDLIDSLALIKDQYPTTDFTCGVTECSYGGAKNRCLENMLCHAGTHVKFSLFYCRSCQIEVRNFYSHAKAVVHSKEGKPLDIYLLSEDRLLTLFKQCYPGPGVSRSSAAEKQPVGKMEQDGNVKTETTDQHPNISVQGLPTSQHQPQERQFVMNPIKEPEGEQSATVMTIVSEPESGNQSVSHEKLGLFKSVLDPQFRKSLMDIKGRYSGENFNCSAQGCSYGGRSNFKLENMVTHVSGKHMRSPVFQCQPCSLSFGSISNHVKTQHGNIATDVLIKPISDLAFFDAINECFPGPLDASHLDGHLAPSGSSIFMPPNKDAPNSRSDQNRRSDEANTDTDEPGDGLTEVSEGNPAVQPDEEGSEENQSILRGSEESTMDNDDIV